MPDLIPTIIPGVESVPPNPALKAESGSITELVPSTVPAPLAPQKNPGDGTNTPVSPLTPKIPNLVNKMKEPEILHAVDSKADTLTTIADKDEEKFIKEVIKEHQDAGR